jgi:vacuolar-type H+-ATPase subunit E/Vma4
MTSGLETIKDRIIEKARNEANTLLLDAAEEKRKALSSSKEEADRSASGILADAENEARVRYEEKLGAIRTDLRKKMLIRREELIEEAWNRAMVELKAYVKAPAYREDLKALVTKTVSLVDEGSVLVDANADDLKYIGEVKAEIERMMGRGGTTKTLLIGREITCIGGVEVSDPQRQVVFDRTYEAKVRKLRSSLRSKLAMIITEGKE